MGDSAFSYFCQMCQVYCSGIETYQQHLNGMKHLKKKKRETNLATVPYGTSLPDHHEEAGNQPFNSSNYTCQECHITMSGPESFMAHVEGQKHAKMMKRQELLKNFQGENSPLVSEAVSIPQQANVLDDTTHRSSPQNFTMNLYHCGLCNAYLSGPESSKQHYDGKQHLKNLRRNQPFGDSTSDPNAVAENLQNVSLDDKTKVPTVASNDTTSVSDGMAENPQNQTLDEKINNDITETAIEEAAMESSSSGCAE